MAPLYFLLLLSVVSHAFIGLYRLAMKWGFMESRNTKVSRRRFKLLMKSLIVIYIVVGSLSLMKYIYIGYTNDFEPGTRYKSTIINLKAH
ncbi:fumarate reductase respiratory complex, transmembrane subunit [Sulfurimonas gotlandica GD1]|nr:fumarate reductase respiratory complex, transmembrane subunit [Sulfurimonas gotlandica GD1]